MDKMQKTKYLIIGNSAGGIGAAEAIRERDREGAISIISDEPYPAYSRPLIADYLASHRPLEKMLFRPPEFYDSHNICTRLGQKVTAVDFDGHSVTLEGGGKLEWSKLLLATGGQAIVPPLEGLELDGVFRFITLDDARGIDAFIANHRVAARAVVIGGGLIGVSATEALTKRGAKVTMVEMKDYILNTILDEETGSIEAAAISRAGVDIITGHTVSKIESNRLDSVSGVVLDDGRRLACDLVVIAIGVRPRMELAAGRDIEQNRGLVVDRFMATSRPDVYACGDVAEAYEYICGENRLTPIWPNAYLGGWVAGSNMAGGQSEYPGGTAMNSMKYFGVDTVSAGSLLACGGCRVVETRYDDIYKKVIIKDGLITGMVFSGDIEMAGIVYNLMKDRVDVSGFAEVLIADDFGLASLPEEIWRNKLALTPCDTTEVSR